MVHRWLKNYISGISQIKYIKNYRLWGFWVIKFWQIECYLFDWFINFPSTLNYNIIKSIFKLKRKICLQNYLYTTCRSHKSQNIHKPNLYRVYLILRILTKLLEHVFKGMPLSLEKGNLKLIPVKYQTLTLLMSQLHISFICDSNVTRAHI
jgi:hypothetical protein